MKRLIVKKGSGKGPGTIGHLIETIEARTIPVVSESSTVDNIIEAFAKSDHSRIAYVVDDDERLTGIITLGDIIKRVFFLYHKPDTNNHSFLEMAVTKTAGDLMHQKTVYAVASDDIEEVLERMIEQNVKEIAVLDDEGKIIADITMVDILIHLRRLEMLKLPEDP